MNPYARHPHEVKCSLWSDLLVASCYTCARYRVFDTFTQEGFLAMFGWVSFQ